MILFFENRLVQVGQIWQYDKREKWRVTKVHDDHTVDLLFENDDRRFCLEFPEQMLFRSDYWVRCS